MYKKTYNVELNTIRSYTQSVHIFVPTQIERNIMRVISHRLLIKLRQSVSLMSVYLHQI